MWQFLLGLIIGDVIGFIICTLCSAENKKLRDNERSDVEKGERDVYK